MSDWKCSMCGPSAMGCYCDAGSKQARIAELEREQRNDRDLLRQASECVASEKQRADGNFLSLEAALAEVDLCESENARLREALWLVAHTDLLSMRNKMAREALASTRQDSKDAGAVSESPPSSGPGPVTPSRQTESVGQGVASSTTVQVTCPCEDPVPSYGGVTCVKCGRVIQQQAAQETNDG